jgi:O-antigen/teichoic acid export membrane protein
MRAAQIVGLIVLSKVIFGVFDILHTGIVLARKLIYYSIIVVLAALLNIVLNIVLIPVWGLTGAALATLVSWVLADILVFIVSQKSYFIEYNTGLLLATVPLMLASVWVTYRTSYSSLFIRSAVCTVGMALILAIYRREVKEVLGWFRQITSRTGV